jgi:hypothetical protein
LQAERAVEPTRFQPRSGALFFLSVVLSCAEIGARIGARKGATGLNKAVQALLDKNCLVDLADGRQPFANELQPVIAAWRRGDLELIAAAITASENQPDNVPPTWEQFNELLGDAGLSDVRILQCPLDWDMGFWGKGERGNSERGRELMATSSDSGASACSASLIPRPRSPRPQAPLRAGSLSPDSAGLVPPPSHERKWVNKKCDVMTVWTHVWHKTDVLLTRDDRMLDRAQELAALGARLEPPARFAARL